MHCGSHDMTHVSAERSAVAAGLLLHHVWYVVVDSARNARFGKELTKTAALCALGWTIGTLTQRVKVSLQL